MTESQEFVLALEQCRESKGMIWHGKIPVEILELYGLEYSELQHGYTIAGVYVKVVPRYESFKPEWEK